MGDRYSMRMRLIADLLGIAPWDEHDLYSTPSTTPAFPRPPLSTSYLLSPGSMTVDNHAGMVTFTLSWSGSTPAEMVYLSKVKDQGFRNDDYQFMRNDALNIAAG